MANWEKDKIEKLKLHYKQFNTPSDQIVKDQNILDKFTELFNTEFTPQEQITSKEIADQIFKLRKSAKLPRLRS